MPLALCAFLVPLGLGDSWKDGTFRQEGCFYPDELGVYVSLLERHEAEKSGEKSLQKHSLLNRRSGKGGRKRLSMPADDPHTPQQTGVKRPGTPGAPDAPDVPDVGVDNNARVGYKTTKAVVDGTTAATEKIGEKVGQLAKGDFNAFFGRKEPPPTVPSEEVRLRSLLDPGGVGRHAGKTSEGSFSAVS